MLGLWPIGLLGGVAGEPGEGRVHPGDRPLPVGDDDRVGRSVEGRALEPQLPLRGLLLLEDLASGERVPDRHRKALEVLLDDVVDRARLDAVGRLLVVERPGDDDERDERRDPYVDPEGLEAAEGRHRVVGQDDVRHEVVKLPDETFGRLDEPPVHVESGSRELADLEVGVRTEVLDEEDTGLLLLHRVHLAPLPGRLVELEPVRPELAHRVREPLEVHRLDDVAVGAEAVGGPEILLLA